MKLYYSDILSARRSCAAARYLKAPVDYIYLSLPKGDHKTEGYLALNPNGKVPTLVDGETIVWESDAVICHLSRWAGADLWPDDAARQIEVVRWLSWGAQHFVRAGGSLYFENIVKARFGIGAPDPGEVEAALADFRRYAAVLDDHLMGRDWVVGDGLTVADFSVAQALPFAADAKMPVEEFENVARWHDRLNDIDAWREPYPQR